ncbi:VOC family protein [Nocardioides sp.]|uniref:VOC family protein n=1 Tax=Nocardioides sp. TaxID=35761 RepID=UPI001A181151|nr:VOC family protein [Nocardioides sp.]MBJ7358538.1 VOC family protein [Nocardioides sp.]
MYLENVVFDAVEPKRAGLFWEAVVGGERLTDEPEGFETRLEVEGGPTLDLCFQRVADPSTDPPRLRLALSGEAGPAEGGADPEGNPCPVVEDAAAYPDAGPLAALRLASADPGRDAAFWSWLTGWVPVGGVAPRSLRHPSQRGAVLELWPEDGPKGTAKNRIHLDVRLEAGEDPDEVEAGVTSRGGLRMHVDWGELPWRSYTDPSGNEFCVLPARPS